MGTGRGKGKETNTFSTRIKFFLKPETFYQVLPIYVKKGRKQVMLNAAIDTTALAAVNYDEELKSLLDKESERTERILRRIDECMSALEKSEKLLQGSN
jgi:hypothetical protein